MKKLKISSRDNKTGASNRIAQQTALSLAEFRVSAKLFSQTMRKLDALYPMSEYSYKELNDHVKEELEKIDCIIKKGLNHA